MALRSSGSVTTTKEVVWQFCPEGAWIPVSYTHLDVYKRQLHFTCDHASNYLPLKGGLPEDRETMIAAIDLALQDQELMRSEYGRGL